MYTGVLEFSKTDPVLLFQKRNYKLHLIIGEKAQLMHPITSVIKIGTVANIIWRAYLPSTCKNHIRPFKDPSVTGASKSIVIVDGFILLHIRLGDLHVKAWFGVVTILEYRYSSGLSLWTG